MIMCPSWRARLQDFTVGLVPAAAAALLLTPTYHKMVSATALLLELAALTLYTSMVIADLVSVHGFLLLSRGLLASLYKDDVSTDLGFSESTHWG